jgi:hypothetical protein
MDQPQRNIIYAGFSAQVTSVDGVRLPIYRPIHTEAALVRTARIFESGNSRPSKFQKNLSNSGAIVRLSAVLKRRLTPQV